MADIQVAVLGINLFGYELAKTLEDYGVQVMCVDLRNDRIDSIAPFVTKAVMADVTSIDVLKELRIQDFDYVIVSMVNHFENAVLTTLALRDLGVSHIITCTREKQKGIILKKVGANEVIHIEREMANKTAKKLLRKSIIDIVELQDGYGVAELNVVEGWIGQSLKKLHLRKNYNINIIAVKSAPDYKMNMSFDGDYVIQEKDRLVVVSQIASLERLDYLQKR